MKTAGLENKGTGVKIGGKVINNLRYAENTTIIAEDLVNKVKHAELRLELTLAKSV